MQSTGQTGRQSSQPVQYGSITVCMSLLLPMMASVGQAAMHRVQPMHQASSMTATPLRAFETVGGIQCLSRLASQRRQAGNALACRRAGTD